MQLLWLLVKAAKRAVQLLMQELNLADLLLMPAAVNLAAQSLLHQFHSPLAAPASQAAEDAVILANQLNL